MKYWFITGAKKLSELHWVKFKFYTEVTVKGIPVKKEVTK